MNYEEKKAKSAELNKAVDMASKELNLRFPIIGSMGQPDHIRALPEYKQLKYKFDVAFQALRVFNSTLTNKEKRQMSKDKRGY